MEYRGLLFLFAAIFLAAAAPAQFKDSQAARLQRALDDLEHEDYDSAKGRHTSTAESAADPLAGLLPLLSPTKNFPTGRKRTHKPRKQTFLPKEVQEHYSSNNEQQETSDESKEAVIEALSSLLQKFDIATHPGQSTTRNDGAEISNPFEEIKILPYRPNQVKRIGNGEDFDRAPDSNQNKDTKEEEETAGEQSPEKAEIEKFKKLKAFVGKTLKLLKYKLRPRSRTPEEDREAGTNPTKWKDLARNLLGTIGDKLDPNDRLQDMDEEQTAEEQVTEEALNGSEEDQDTEEEAAAKIEGFRTFLRNALRLINRKLQPSSRTPEEDREAVNNPKKWTDLGRNFLEVLQDKLNKGGKGSLLQEEVETERFFSEPNTDGVEEDQTAEEQSIGKLSRLLLRLFRRLKRRG